MYIYIYINMIFSEHRALLNPDNAAMCHRVSNFQIATGLPGFQTHPYEYRIHFIDMSEIWICGNSVPLKKGSNCRKCDLWMCSLAYLVHGRTACELSPMLLLRPGSRSTRGYTEHDRTWNKSELSMFAGDDVFTEEQMSQRFCGGTCLYFWVP